ncbi:LacI family DNA-binding transcriptional regulator [Maribacter sp. X9]|uniref:LacI family DNA-binding transcriptional regulator n=1 Tax=Maribacter sp. X9 TaxID=3402159 RepID=UPI003AF38246
MSKKTTIYDIASALNITAATVSRALNDNPRISKNTRELVASTAAKMNYEQNRLALALKSGKSNNVGVVVPYINNNFFSSIIRGIEDELYPKGYHVIISQTYEDVDREIMVIQNLLNAQVDGILISTSLVDAQKDNFLPILKKNAPFIFFDRKLNISNISSVTIDDYQGGFDATQHLINQGCKKIAHLKVNNGQELYTNRSQGYIDALTKNSIDFDPNYIIPIKNNIQAGKEAAERLMNMENRPDSIFSSTDNGLLGAIKYLQEKGIRIPEDFCVVGFSNEPFTQFMEPSISSIDQSPVEMGRMTAQVFLEQMDSEEKMKIQKIVVLPAKLIIRKSSSKLEAPEHT